MKYVTLAALVAMFTACTPVDDTHEELPATGGFLHVECPAGYLCPPFDDGSCYHVPMQLAPTGLCSYACEVDEDCPALKGSTCIEEFMCGSVCVTDQDCIDMGYEEPVHCWEAIPDVMVCANPAYEPPVSLADSTG